MAEKIATNGGHTTLSARVLKVMGLFSGVQAIMILCSILRTKLVAIWLGPAGIGLFGLYNSVLETLGAVTQTGIGTGVIRQLALSPRKALPRLITIIRRWSLGLGLIGALLTLILSPHLSRITFGDESRTTGFVILAAAVLLFTLSNTEGAVFQGLKRYTRLAETTVAGAVGGLLVSAPMFYFWGLDSVIPSLMAYAVITWLCRGLYRERVEKPADRITAKETFVTGKSFALLGLYMTVTVFAANAVSYIFMSYLNRTAGTETAGLYQAGFTLVNRYVGLVLTAIGMEYLPRLSEVSRSPHRMELFMTHEIILIMLVILPVVTIFISADELMVSLLYNKQFITILPFIGWAVVGTVFRAWAWCLAYVILAKADGVIYLVTELLSALAAIGLNIFFYDRYGISGLGYAYTIWYLFYLIEVMAVCRLRYRLRVKKNAVLFPIAVFIICGAAAVMKQYFGVWTTMPFVAISLIIGFAGLRQLLRHTRKTEKFVQPAEND